MTEVDPTVWPVSSPTIVGGMNLCQGLDDMGWDQFGYCGYTLWISNGWFKVLRNQAIVESGKG